MAGQFKTYKLVPQNIFQDLIKNKNDELQNRNIEAPQQQQEQKATMPSWGRSISDIVDRKTTGEGSSNALVLGGNKNNLQWLYTDDSKLPQYSKQNKIVDSFDKYKEILNANIPDNLKIKLMHLYKDKYDSYRLGSNFDDGDPHYDSDDDDDFVQHANLPIQQNEQNERNKPIAKLLMTLPKNKMSAVRGLVEDFEKEPEYLHWNAKGVLKRPAKYANTPHMNIIKLIKIMTTKSIVTPTELSIIKDILKPIYTNINISRVKNEQIEQFIVDLYKKNHNGNRSVRNRSNTRKAAKNIRSYQNMQ